MWIATNGGGLAKAKYVPDSAFYRFEVLSEKNGLPSNEIHSITFSHLVMFGSQAIKIFAATILKKTS